MEADGNSSEWLYADSISPTHSDGGSLSFRPRLSRAPQLPLGGATGRHCDLELTDLTWCCRWWLFARWSIDNAVRLTWYWKQFIDEMTRTARGWAFFKAAIVCVMIIREMESGNFEKISIREDHDWKFDLKSRD